MYPKNQGSYYTKPYKANNSNMEDISLLHYERDKEIRLEHSVQCPLAVAVYKVNLKVDCAFDKSCSILIWL